MTGLTDEMTVQERCGGGCWNASNITTWCRFKTATVASRVPVCVAAAVAVTTMLPLLESDTDYVVRLNCAYLVITFRTCDSDTLDGLIGRCAACSFRTPQQVQPAVQAMLHDVHWTTLENVLGKGFDAGQLLMMTAATLHDRFAAFLAGGSLDQCNDKRVVTDRLKHISDAFNLFGRNLKASCEKRTVTTVFGEIDLRNPAERVDAAKLVKLFFDRRDASGNSGSSQGSSSCSQGSVKGSKRADGYCPPIGLGLAGAMLVQLTRYVLHSIQQQQRYGPLGPKDAKTVLLQTMVIREIQLSLVMGNRSEAELPVMRRYQQIFVLVGNKRVTLRALQLAGMDICLAYLRAGFPVFFELRKVWFMGWVVQGTLEWPLPANTKHCRMPPSAAIASSKT